MAAFGNRAEAGKQLAKRLSGYAGRSDVVVILVDDGLATGSTMRAAIEAARREGAARIVVAVPVAAATTFEEFRQENVADDVVCLLTPEPFFAVGSWYDDFSQLADEDVHALLERAAADYAVHSC